MTDTTKIRDAIRDTLWRNLDMVETHSTVDGAYLVRRADVRLMLDACANNLAMMFGDYVAEERDACADRDPP